MQTEAHGELGETWRPHTDVDPKATRPKYNATVLAIKMEVERAGDDLGPILTLPFGRQPGVALSMLMMA